MQQQNTYYRLMIVIGILILCGGIFLSTLSAPASMKIFNNTHYYLVRQLIALSISIIMGVMVFFIPMRFIKKVIPLFFFLNLLFLGLVFLPFLGLHHWGASRWISIGGINFQPSEFIKLTAILYLSALLANRYTVTASKNWVVGIKKGYDVVMHVFIPFLLLLGVISGLLYFQKDATTLGVIIIPLLTIYFLAHTPWWHTLVTVLGGILGGIFFIVAEPYRVQRLLTLLNPEIDPLGKGLQIKQSLIALGSGGFLGRGLGLSTQKFGFLPQAMTDSMFAIIGEETGFVGVIILIFLFVFLWYTVVKMVSHHEDAFSRLVALGIVTWILIQALINIASSIGLFPITGVPLPFFSYGGSHLMAEIIGVALILKIARKT